MKILFYGGCHAAALKEIFERYGQGVSYSSSLTNYQLIRENIPFPYENVAKYDVVIFNPIRNKESYNTVYLEEFLSKKNIPYFKYPWIQWNGYFPNYSNTKIGQWYQGWWPVFLDKLVTESDDLNNFLEKVFLKEDFEQLVVSNFNETTFRLNKNESDCDIKLSQYILENYKNIRLFLTPNHPSSHLYKYLASKISDLINIQLDNSFEEIDHEVQSGSSLPILPSVKKVLNLRFPAGSFCNKFIFNSPNLSIKEYLNLIYCAKEIKKLIAKNNTRVYRIDFIPESLGKERFNGKPISFQKGSRILAKYICRIDKLYDEYFVHASYFDSSSNANFYPCSVKVYRGHWIQTKEELGPEVLGDENTNI